MKNNEVKQKFIELRASGLSFDKISKELDTSKVTLMKWEKEFSQEIKQIIGSLTVKLKKTEDEFI